MSFALPAFLLSSKTGVIRWVAMEPKACSAFLGVRCISGEGSTDPHSCPFG